MRAGEYRLIGRSRPSIRSWQPSFTRRLTGTSAPPILRLRRAATCGGCVPVGTNGRRGSSLVAPAAAVRCVRARWCPGSGRWRTSAPRWPRSFTPRATATWTRRGWRPGPTARSGGGAVGAMCGRPRCPAGRRGAAVPSAIAGVGPGGALTPPRASALSRPILTSIARGREGRGSCTGRACQAPGVSRRRRGERID